MEQKSKLSKADTYALISMTEYRLRYLESTKWTTKNDEARVAEMHRLEVLWQKLIGQLGLFDRES